MAYASSAPVVGSQERFHCAASQGILSSVLALGVEGRFPCDLPDHFGRTPLRRAAEQRHPSVVIKLLGGGACADPRSQRRSATIALVASEGHADFVGLLIHSRAGESDC